MFDIGFSEIALVALVALIVLGPERLPRVARTAGALLRRARTSWQGVRDEIERELAAEDLKKSMQDLKRQVDVRGDLQEMARGVESATHEPVATTPPETTPPDPPRP